MSNIQYIVSGHGRSGTSMMMRCLEMGGIVGHYDKGPQRGRMANKYGPYEVPEEESTSKEAYATKWRGMYEHPGKVVKILAHKIKHVPANGEFRVVYMLRDPEKILASYKRAWGQNPNSKPMQDAAALKDPKYYWDWMNDNIAMLKAEPNVLSVTALSFDDVVENPREVFEFLVGEGWPLDVEKAIKGVEPEEKHF